MGCFDGRLGQRLHLDEPLLAHQRLDYRMTAVAMSHRVVMVLNLCEYAALRQIGHQLLAAFIAVHTGIFSGQLIHFPLLVNDYHLGQIMAIAHLKIIGIMGRRNFYSAGTKFLFHILISNHRNNAVHDRQYQIFAHQMAVARIIRMHSHCRIAQHRFRTGGGNLNTVRTILRRIPEIINFALLVHMFHFNIRNGRLTMGAPVYNIVALIDQALLIQTHKGFSHSLRTALIHGKPFSVPVTGAAQLAQLRSNRVAIFLFPGPGAAQKLLAPYFIAVGAFLLQLRLHLCLGCNPGMIRARNPQRVKPAQPFIPHQNILHGVVHGMPHVQLTGYIWRRHHDRKTLFSFLHFSRKIFILLPHRIPMLLYLLRVIHLR